MQFVWLECELLITGTSDYGGMDDIGDGISIDSQETSYLDQIITGNTLIDQW